MTFIEKIRLIERLDGLIQGRATGSPKQLSEKLGISERCKYDIINLMKNMGAPINYCNVSTRYYYEGEVEFQIGFGNKNRNITGGINIFSPLQDSCSSTPYFYKIFLPLNAYKWWEDRKKIFSELLGLV